MLESIKNTFYQGTRKVKNGINNVNNTVIDAVEWKNPVATSIYLMLVNSSFWYLVFYLNNEKHELILYTVIALLIIWDLCLRIIRTEWKTKWKCFSEQWNTFRSLDLSGKLWHTTIWILTLGPITALLFPPLKLLLSSVYHNTPQVLILILCGCSLWKLQEKDLEAGCWLAYAMVLVIVAAPPWKCNQISERIACFVSDKAQRTWNFVLNRILIPVFNCIVRLLRLLKYIVFGEWIPPLYRKLRSAFIGLCKLIKANIIDPIVYGVTQVLKGIRYVLFGYWIPPLIAFLSRKAREFATWFKTKIIDPIVHFVRVLWSVFTYIVLFKWVPPLLNWIYHKFIAPTIRAAKATYRAFIYIVTGGWIPGLINFCRNLKERGSAFLWEELEKLWLAILDLKNQIKAYFITEWIEPIKELIRNIIHGIKKAVRNTIAYIKATTLSIIHSIKEGVKYLLYETKEAIKTKIIQPSIRLSRKAAIATLVFIGENIIIPCWNYFKQFLRDSQAYAIVKLIDPMMEWIKNQLPEKSPFCDDSDTEVKDFLPGTRTDSESEEEPSPETRLDDFEAKEFAAGLAFPKEIKDSDSSDEEFSLREKVKKPSAGTRVRRRKIEVKQSEPNKEVAEFEKNVASVNAIAQIASAVLTKKQPPKKTRKSSEERLIDDLLPSENPPQRRKSSEDDIFDDLLPQSVPDIDDDDFEILN